MPYLYVPPIKIGPITIHVFGIIAVLAIFLGVKVIRYRTLKLGLNIELIDRLMPWFVLGVIGGAHLVSAIFYFPEKVIKEPAVIIKFWDGLSSYGGIFGGIIVAYFFFRRKRVRMRRYVNVFVLGAVICLLVGRMGCSIAHDHPGKLTEFPLAVKGWPVDNQELERGFGFYTEGQQRHDLGLYEFIFMIPVAAMVLALRNYRPSGYFHAILAIFIYTPVRFMLDFLRVSERLYYGLTPGQYFSIVTFLFGVYLIFCELRNSGKNMDNVVSVNE